MKRKLSLTPQPTFITVDPPCTIEINGQRFDCLEREGALYWNLSKAGVKHMTHTNRSKCKTLYQDHLVGYTWQKDSNALGSAKTPERGLFIEGWVMFRECLLCYGKTDSKKWFSMYFLKNYSQHIS